MTTRRGPLAPLPRLRRAAAILAFSLLPGFAVAQDAGSLPAGSRVRVTLPDTMRAAPLIPQIRSMIGSVVRATPDTLYLEVGVPGTLAVPRAALRRIEVSRGTSRGRSALQQGLLAGAMFALMVAVDETDGHRNSPGTIAGWAAGGLALGGVVGFAFPYEHWRPIRR